MGENLRKLLYATVAGAPLALILGGGQALAGAVITYGATSLGVNDTGELNFSGFGPGGPLTYGVFRAGIGDAISPGCFCEGWGVSTVYDGFTTSGWANQDSGGAFGLTGGTFGSTATTASSTVGLADAPVSVSHLFGPSLQADIFQVNVTITNTGTATAEDVRYRRVMDWDVPPTIFDEFVTHQGVVANLTGAGGNVLFASDDGFASGDPLTGPSSIDPATIDTDFIDNGPDDHGSLFDFSFGDLAAGESRTFNIFYGSRDSEASALAALAGLGVDVFSLGQSNPGTGGNPDGTPATFIFAFGGVGGVAPGETEENPVLPFVPAPGQFEFPAPQPRLWYDPPFAEGFTYTIAGPGAEFIEVMAPLVGFTGPFDIVIDGVVVASIAPGGSYFFDPLDDVTTFDLVGILPLLDIAGPGFATAFPTFLDFTGGALSLTMTAILADGAPVPEPGTLLLFGAGLTFVMRLRSGQRRVAAAA
ncbi:MAG: PEP-CTERM sorting domain-containing protein [Rhodoferax sp.]|nr:PEP-CTERM sorting domain-containing protein [Rhodoferax sp.]